MGNKLVIGIEAETKSFDMQIAQTEKKLQELEQKYKEMYESASKYAKETGLEVNESAFTDIKNEIEKTNNKLIQLKSNQESLNKLDFSSLGNSIQKVTGRIAKMAVAVFGIRSAFMFVRNSINTIANDDQQLKADIDYMKNALAYTLEPVVRTVVNLAKQLLYYVAYIVKAWTGKNIFAGASKNLSSASKSAKELKKSLAGFDEANVLSSSTSAGGGGGATPSFDLSDISNMKVPAWIEWIANNKSIVIGALAGITAGLIALNTLGLKPIMSIGIGAIVGGVIMLIQDIVAYISDPSWQNFANILGDIAIIIGGVMMVAMNSWWGLLVVVVGLAVKLIANNWDKVKEILSVVGQWIYDNVLMPTLDFITAVGETILSIIQGMFSVINGIFTTLISVLSLPFEILRDTVVGVFNGIKTTIQGVFNIIKGLFTGDWKTVMSGFKQIFKGTFDSLWSIAKAPLNLLIGGINSLIKGINKISFDVPDWVPVIGGDKWGFNIKTIPKLAKGGIINMPGTGVMSPYGNAIRGEAGAEGVIPLTDSQQMALLGEAIGKYVKIQNIVDVNFDSKKVNRILKQSESRQNIGINGGVY